jgi:hypothetical protein
VGVGVGVGDSPVLMTKRGGGAGRRQQQTRCPLTCATITDVSDFTSEGSDSGAEWLEQRSVQLHGAVWDRATEEADKWVPRMDLNFEK